MRGIAKSECVYWMPACAGMLMMRPPSSRLFWRACARRAFAAAALDGTALRWPWALPFIGILLTIATGPLLFPRVWHHHYGKLAFVWATLTLAPLAALTGRRPRSPPSCMRCSPNI